MFKLAIIGSISAFAYAQQHPVNQELVEEIKQKTNSWAPHAVEENPMSGKSMTEIMGLLGTHLQGPVGLPDPIPVNGVPSTFDSREQWEGCVHDIRDQASCGSCWAFAASEAMSDRVCIASKGAVNVVLSPEDMVACDRWNMGCDGGILSWAWSYLTKTGVVADECFPYTSNTGKVPACATKCVNSSDPFKKYKCIGGSVVEAKGVDQIKAEIFQNGPVETGFTVYEDFMNYKSGVYHHTSGKQLGGHAVKIIGWGDGYWICANSWSTSWGEDGFFRIAFNDSGIDQAAYGCKPQL